MENERDETVSTLARLQWRPHPTGFMSTELFFSFSPLLPPPPTPALIPAARLEHKHPRSAAAAAEGRTLCQIICLLLERKTGHPRPSHVSPWLFRSRGLSPPRCSYHMLGELWRDHIQLFHTAVLSVITLSDDTEVFRARVGR